MSPMFDNDIHVLDVGCGPGNFYVSYHIIFFSMGFDVFRVLLGG